MVLHTTVSLHHCDTVRTLHKPLYLQVLVLGLGVLDYVNLVLKDNDVFELHNLNGRQVF